MHPRLVPFATALISIAAFLRPHALEPIMTSEYSPRRALYMANPWLLWTNVTSDFLIGLSYVLFFIGISYLIGKLRHIREIRGYLWVFAAFRIFVLASGAIVLIRIAYIWFPLYPFALGLKIICAAASIPTAILFASQARAVATNINRFFTLMKTEHEHAEALRESQELLDRTGRIAGVGGWTLDLETNEVSWTAETYLIHGVGPEYQPSLANGLQFFTPEYRAVIEEAVERAKTTGQPWDMEVGLVRADGRHIWVRTVGEVDHREGQRPRLIGALQDKTAQIAVRKELRQANERVTLATDSGGIGIFDWDIQKDLCTSDPWMHRLYGNQSTGQATPLSYWARSIHPEDRAGVIEALDDAIADRRPYDIEFRVVWDDGSVHHLRATGRVTRDKEGRALHMIGANWDVTESRRLTAELAEQHELLRITLQSIGDGVITTDAQRNVAWLNPAAERMTGWSTTEAIGRPLAQIFQTIDEETRQPVENPIASDLAPGSASLAKHTLLVSRDHNEFGIENLAAPIRDAHGNLQGNVLVFRDVTEQRRLAAETGRVTKLQLELKMKDEFLSHVSHELRSPLTSIYSFTSIISDDLAGETNAEQKEYLQIILKNVVQLQSMIEDLLTVTQSREGKLTIDLKNVPCADAIADALHTAQGAASSKQISLSANDSSHVPSVCADPTRLRQILIILLDNAIKFTPSGGKVNVRASERDAGFVLFQVTDTGCGIPPEMRTRVFENLYQITGPNQPDTSQAGRTGLGLGLHIARNLVTRQGGYIWVNSAPNQGSIFSFTLPVYSDHSVAAGEVGPTPRRRKTDWPEADAPALVSAASGCVAG